MSENASGVYSLTGKRKYFVVPWARNRSPVMMRRIEWSGPDQEAGMMPAFMGLSLVAMNRSAFTPNKDS
jgi:hypothetical protein